MKIIKYGAIPKRTRLIECKSCGTIFEAEESELKGTSQIAMLHDNLPPYYCKCPVCYSICYTN